MGPSGSHREAARSSASVVRGLLSPASGGHPTSSSHLQGSQPTVQCAPCLSRLLRPTVPAPRGPHEEQAVDLHELVCFPVSSAPAPSWAVKPAVSTANSCKEPEGAQDLRCGRRVGSECKHSAKAHFHTDVFSYKLGWRGLHRTKRARLLTTRPAKSIRPKLSW